MNSLENTPELKQKICKSSFFENLWTVTDVAEYLRLPSKTVYAWVHQRRIPFLKVGNRLRFRGREIEKWLSMKGDHNANSKN